MDVEVAGKTFNLLSVFYITYSLNINPVNIHVQSLRAMELLMLLLTSTAQDV